MSKNDLIQQICFVNKSLPIYNIKCLSDYVSTISQKQITSDMITQINLNMDEFKNLFPTNKFNLSRKKYQIDTSNLAMSFLRKCL